MTRRYAADRQVEPPLVAKSDAQNIVRFGKVGPKRDRTAQRGDRFVEPALALQENAEIAVRLGKVGPERDRTSQRGDRFVEPALFRKRDSQVAVRQDKVRLELDRPMIGGDRQVEPALARQGVAQVTVGLGKVGPKRDRPVVGGDRLVEPALLRQGIAQEVVAIVMIGLELERTTEGVDRLVGPAHLGERKAEVVVGRGQPGLQFDRAAKADDRPFPLSRAPVTLTQIRVIPANGRVNANRPADQIDRNFQVARLAGHQSQRLQPPRLIGRLAQNLAKDSLGLGQSAGLVVPDGDLQRLFDGDLRHELRESKVPVALASQLLCLFPDVSYVSIMDTNDHRIYRVLFWMATVVAAVSIAGWHFAARGVEDQRLDDPHELSKYRGIEYPFTVDVYGYKYQGKTGDYIDDHIRNYGAYEKDVLFFMRDYVEARKNPNAVFLDVGACEGQHSLFMSRLVKQVHAFEPYPPAADRFQGLIDLNQFTNIRLHRVGLGDKDATVPFFAPPEKNIGSGTFLSDHKQGAAKPVGNFRVVNGDEWLEPLRLPALDLIKIDVEGFEKYVLQGLAKSLARYRPVLVIEVSYPPIGKIANLAELRRLFPEGYQLLTFQSTRDQVITGNYKLDPMPELKTDTSYCMVVAYPKERESMIRRERK